ncbi:MAG TPA: ribosomal protein S18-alanine N-acetyltransferase [Polyangiaceae bacterium]|nr:ribosomal protein S18-alanine N-acetyltransferase [Polyangiaceae bacterium]
MTVSAAMASDCSRIRELARYSKAGFDPEEELARPWARLWVVRPEPDGEPLGFALAWHAADEVHLLDLAVDESARRRGVARELVAALLGYARETAARLVLLEVRRSNAAAIGLYRSAGFTENGVRRAYYSDNGEDALEMSIELTETR